MSNGRQLTPVEEQDAGPLTVTQLVGAYAKHVEVHHAAKRAEIIKSAICIARRLYGSKPAAIFRPAALEKVRVAMTHGHSEKQRFDWPRKTVIDEIAITLVHRPERGTTEALY